MQRIPRRHGAGGGSPASLPHVSLDDAAITPAASSRPHPRRPSLKSP